MRKSPWRSVALERPIGRTPVCGATAERHEDLTSSAQSRGRRSRAENPEKEGTWSWSSGGANASEAASYPKGLCKEWVKEIVGWRCELADRKDVLADVTLAQEGRKAKRHRIRGPTESSKRELRETENQECLAGMRNPVTALREWPSLIEAVADVGQLLRHKISRAPSFQGLAGCCGASPSRGPPSETMLALLRNQVEEVLGLPRGAAAKHHPAAPWRFEIIRAIQRRCADPDAPLSTWLEHGAPMGLECPIESGGLFPKTAGDPELDSEQLASQERWTHSHPSFEEQFGLERPPGVGLLEEHLEEGFGELFSDTAAASEHFGVDVHPAPLATIGKERPDGTWKFRIIQDMKRNKVNAAVQLPERQVLPRPIDYTWPCSRSRQDRMKSRRR